MPTDDPKFETTFLEGTVTLERIDTMGNDGWWIAMYDGVRVWLQREKKPVPAAPIPVEEVDGSDQQQS